MLNTKGMRFPIDVILVCIRWYAAYPLSYRHLEEMMQERGVMVDHSSINRWAVRFLPLLEKVFRNHKHAVGKSWRMDETYIKVKGVWKYLYRAVDKQGKTVDFLLTAKRDASAARRFFDKAMRYSDVPDTVTMDKSGANKAALDQVLKRPERNASEKQLQTGIPMFIDQLTQTLRAEQEGKAASGLRISGAPGGDRANLSEIGVTATAHGAELLRLGYTVDQVVHDYGDLCQAISDLAVERDAPFAIDEYRTLNRCLYQSHVICS